MLIQKEQCQHLGIVETGTPSPSFPGFSVCGMSRHLSPSCSLPTHLLVQEPFRPPGTFRPVLSQGTDAPCWGPGRNPLHGEPQSDVSWLQGPGSWPRRAGNAPNTLPLPIAKGREGPSERPFYSDSQTKSVAVGVWEVVGKYVNGLVKIQ